MAYFIIYMDGYYKQKQKPYKEFCGLMKFSHFFECAATSSAQFA